MPSFTRRLKIGIYRNYCHGQWKRRDTPFLSYLDGVNMRLSCADLVVPEIARIQE